MKARLAPILFVAAVFTTLGGACNDLSGINALEIVSSSNADAEGGGESGSGGDAAGSDDGNPGESGEADTREGAAGGGDAPDDVVVDQRAQNDAPEEPTDAVTDATTDVATPPVDAANGDAYATTGASDATTDVSDATSGSTDVAAEATVSDSGCAVATPVCDGGCPTAHSDGLGQMFYDCAPWSTFNETQALEACTAFTGSATQCANDPIGCANTDEVCATGTSACPCWLYTGKFAGKVFVSTTASCTCYVAGAPSWN